MAPAHRSVPSSELWASGPLLRVCKGQPFQLLPFVPSILGAVAASAVAPSLILQLPG